MSVTTPPSQSTMNVKYLRAAGFSVCCVTSLGSVAEGISPYAHVQLGECFSSSNAAIKAVSGSDEGSDENVKLIRRKDSSNSFWILDQTASHNFKWYLLEPRGNRKCILLYIPFAAEVTSKLEGGMLTIEAKTQASPGFPTYIMQFRKSARLGYFVPHACYSEPTAAGGQLGSRRELDCLEIGK